MKAFEIKITKELKKDFAKAEKVNSTFQLYSSLPDPDKILADNNYDYSILRDLLNDPHLSAVVQQRKSLVQQLGWEISCEGDKESERKVVLWMQQLDVDGIIGKMLDAVLFGFSVLEINWGIKGNEVFPRQINSKPQEGFIFDKENQLRLRQKNESGYTFCVGEELPRNKFLIIQHNAEYVNPYGEKIISKCYWPVQLKRSGLDFWQIMVERYGMPFLIGRYPSTATEKEKSDLLTGLQNMVKDNIAIFLDTVGIELKEHPKFDIGQLYQYLAEFYNQEISKAILTETLTTEIRGMGSYAAAQVHRETATTVAMKDKKLIENSMNELLRLYSKLNYGEQKSIRFRLTKKGAVEAESIDRDIKLKNLGIEFRKEYFQRKYNLNEDDFEISQQNAVGSRQ